MSAKRVVSLPILLFIAILIAIFFVTPSVTFAATVDLGNVANFAVMGAAAISDTPSSVITGDVGLWSNGGASITGLRCIEVTGTIYDNNGAYTGNPTGTSCLNTSAGTLTTAHTSLTSAYNDAAGRTPTTTYTPVHDLGGATLTPGVYNDPSSFAITGTLTLDGGGDANAVFIFQAGSTLTTASSSQVVLTGSAQSCNVFWQVGSSVTLGTSTSFVGNILAYTSITDSGSSTVDGRLLAGSTVDSTGAVTLNKTTVAKSTCVTPTPTPTATPTPTPTPATSPTSSSSSSSSSSNSGGSSGVFSPDCPALNPQIVIPIITESRRVSPTSIFIGWGPYSGTNLFSIQYGLSNGNWLYSTDVTGFSTTINNLPPNLPIWVRIAPRSDCRIGGYGISKLIGGVGAINPILPSAGIGPEDNNIQWSIAVTTGIGLVILTSLIVILKKRSIQ